MIALGFACTLPSPVHFSPTLSFVMHSLTLMYVGFRIVTFSMGIFLVFVP